MVIQLNDNLLENKLLKLSNQLHIKIEELVKNLLLKQLQSDELIYQKKDVIKYIKPFNEEIENNIELTNPFVDVSDVNEYSKKLRENSWK